MREKLLDRVEFSAPTVVEEILREILQQPTSHVFVLSVHMLSSYGGCAQ